MDGSGDLPVRHVVRVDKRGTRTVVSDNIWEHETANDPDAAANAILKVDRRGDISTVAVVPASRVQFTAELEEYYEGLLEGFVADTGTEMNTDIPDCVVGRKFTPAPVPTASRSATYPKRR